MGRMTLAGGKIPISAMAITVKVIAIGTTAASVTRAAAIGTTAANGTRAAASGTTAASGARTVANGTRTVAGKNHAIETRMIKGGGAIGQGAPLS